MAVAGVAVAAVVGVATGVARAVGVGLGVGVLVGVAVGMGVGVLVGGGVGMGVGVLVAVAVGTGIGVLVGMGVGVPVGVAVGMGVDIADGVEATLPPSVGWAVAVVCNRASAGGLVPTIVVSPNCTGPGNATPAAPSGRDTVPEQPMTTRSPSMDSTR